MSVDTTTNKCVGYSIKAEYGDFLLFSGLQIFYIIQNYNFLSS